ncbi:MAG: prepilin-type N-terminal cleavage/methylation domain-containing protein [Burkholderiales bacterium]
MKKRRMSPGFTLIEAVVVIVITGVIAATVGIFVVPPIQAYLDVTRRAELTDIADTALRRIGRDLRTALPNSIRIASNGGATYLEFLQTAGGGRYRASPDSAGGGNVLEFTTAVTAFDVIGPAPALAAGDQIVVYNLGGGSSESDAYNGNNRSAFVAFSTPTITIASKQFPFFSPGRRFHVVRQPVTYKCDPVTNELRRYWGYAITAAQATPPVTANSALLAQRVTGCDFRYDVSPTPALQRTGTVSLRIELTAAGEKVNLFQQVHVDNTP